MVRYRYPQWAIHRMDRNAICRRFRQGLLIQRDAARPDRGARYLVLSSKARLAFEADVHLPAMGNQLIRLVAILISAGRAWSRRRCVGVPCEKPGATRSHLVFCRVAVSGAWVLQRIS